MTDPIRGSGRRADHRAPTGADIARYLRGVRIVDDPIDGTALTSDEGRAELDYYVWLHRRSNELALAMLLRHVAPAGDRTAGRGRTARALAEGASTAARTGSRAAGSSTPATPVAPRPLRVLELGGAPYFFSALVHHVLGAELVAANVQAGAWPGEAATLDRGIVTLAVPGGAAGPTVTLAVPGDAAGPTLPTAVPAEPGAAIDEAGQTADREARLAIDVRVLNIERDPFPFEDASFDVVLCMEVLEHLGYSPSHMLAEAHRVLQPGGLLLVTVPNFIHLKRTVSMLLNRRCQYPYSGYGIYGRHQREYAPGEVRDLLRACHYEILELSTANVWPTWRGSLVVGMGNALLNALGRLPLPWLSSKGELILCAARTFGEPVAAYPAWLYQHRHLYPDPPHGVAKTLE